MNIQKKKGLIVSLALLGLTIGQSDLLAAHFDPSVYVKTDINSGNPSFPFPQFLEYKTGKSLAKYNAEGVTHADMEKTMREGYQIMSHRCRYEGETHCGVPYISFNNFPKFGDKELPQGAAEFCTEGDGYMLLASAIFADQPTFNGLWMWIHDNRLSKVKKYSDGEWLRKGYEKNGQLVCKDPETGLLAGWIASAEDETGASKTHSAADGDYDIAMALLIAYKQWGEFMYQDGKQVKDAEGNPISYKAAAQNYIKALVDTIPFYSFADGELFNGKPIDGFNGYLTGDIGVDGYPKGGDSWGELTNWRTTQTLFDPKLSMIPSMGGGGGSASYVDYNAPSYFNEFAYWLEKEDGNGTPWQINQFKRAEASSDWVAGQLYKQGGIASVGKYQINADNSVTFSPFNSGEDFRFAWRHILNYLWHGNPTTTWEPETHTVKEGGNTFEYDLAVRHAKFMKEPSDGLEGELICSKLGFSPNPDSPNWFGPCQISQCYDMDGTVQQIAHSNYALGCAAPSVVALGDLELLGDMYRQSELVWDDASAESKDLTDDERYINSMPKYFHGWFRCLGLLTHSGNLHAPRNMVPAANVKVYMSVDKTFAYKGKNVTYGVQYRNYGAAEAKEATITTKLDPNYEFVSATKGGTYNAGNHSIIWNVGSIPGFKSGHLEETMDTVSFTVNVKGTENKRIALTSTINGANFEEWISNEYPNNATYTMERNLVDILDNPFIIKKGVDMAEASVNDTVEYTLTISSNKETDWLNGGRDNVRLSYGNYRVDGDNEGDYFNTKFYQYYRFTHDAPEAYINMGNYRVSYYTYDEEDNDGLIFETDNYIDGAKYGYYTEEQEPSVFIQNIQEGSDEYGKWNKRIILRFPNVLTAATSHVEDKLDSKYLIHKGVWGPGLYRSRLSTKRTCNMALRVADDWSYSVNVENNGKFDNLSGQDCYLHPVTPGWYNDATLGEEINSYARHTCNDEVESFDRVVVEEWDGYTWRRIQGRGPLCGAIYNNVELTDQLPKGLKFIGQSDESGIKLKEEEGKLSVNIAKIETGKDIILKYRCQVIEGNDAGVIETEAATLETIDGTVESNTTALTLKTTGVENITINENELVDVYNTNGVLLKRQVEYKNALNGLKTGVYMVNGVKSVHIK